MPVSSVKSGSIWLQLSANAPPGVWVCSTDMMLSVSPDSSMPA